MLKDFIGVSGVAPELAMKNEQEFASQRRDGSLMSERTA